MIKSLFSNAFKKENRNPTDSLDSLLVSIPGEGGESVPMEYHYRFSESDDIADKKQFEIYMNQVETVLEDDLEAYFVLNYIADGKQNREIAPLLNIEESNVSNAKKRLKNKLSHFRKQLTADV
jgi:DNA-directed RNA polymerase specialized sigma subunit